MKNTFSIALAVATLFLTACAGSPPPGSPEPEQPPKEVPVAPAPSGKARVINITTDYWAFAPNMIRVKRGENVQLRITGKNGIHGFAVAELGINESITPGETVTVNLPTDKPGSYRLFCSIVCGPGHGDMEGTILIE